MLLAWTDLETTGSDINADFILELGIVVTDENFEELGRKAWLVKPQDDWAWLNRIKAVDVVREMHSRNGLVCDIIFKARQNVLDVDINAASWLRNFLRDVGEEKAVMAGTGIGPFDKPLIKNQMPRLDNNFHYYTFDIGVVRRMARVYSPLLAEAAEEALRTVPKGAHRSLADIDACIEEAKFYRAYLFDGIQHLMERAA